MSALDVQVGGGHYKDMTIQPAEFITRNKIGWLEGNVIKRVCRWRNKDGVQDLRKAIHELELLIEMEQPQDKCIISPKLTAEVRRQAADRADLALAIATLDDPLGTGMQTCKHTGRELLPMEHPFGHVYQCVDCGARTVK